MNNTNIKLEKAFKSKGTPKVNINNKDNPKWNKKKSLNQKNTYEYAWKKVPPKQSENERKTMNKTFFNWCKQHKAWVEY